MKKQNYNEINKSLFHQLNLEIDEKVKKQIKEEIIKNNTLLVHKIAKKYKWTNIEHEDLFQLGCLGLVKAINNFDINRGFEFSTYAVPMISGEIKRDIRDNNYIHISRSTKDKINKMHFTYNLLLDKLKREPNDKELSDDMEISLKELDKIKQISKDISMRYLDEILYRGKDGSEDITLGDKLVSNKDEIKEFINSHYIKELMSVLDKNETNIIKKRYFEDKVQTKIAKELNLNQVQVSRLEKRALNKMKIIVYSSDYRGKAS